MNYSSVPFDENNRAETKLSEDNTPNELLQYHDEDAGGCSSAFASLYKQTGTKLSQEERRQELLKKIKLRRNETLNQRRGIVENEVEDSENEVDEVMDVSEKKTRVRRRKKERCKLMLSEWLTDIPHDFETHWLVKLCPRGSRTLVVACSKVTKAYNKFGVVKSKFYSMLPGGSPASTTYAKPTILDCIYCHYLQTYFVLDVLTWNNTDLRECETDFRFYFVQSKLNETPGLKELNIFNKYKFIETEYFPVVRSVIEDKVLEHYTVNETLKKLDGILFYHKETPYLMNANPLVVWLKPSMLPDKLQISVPEHYMKNKMEDFQIRAHGKKEKAKEDIKMDI